MDNTCQVWSKTRGRNGPEPSLVEVKERVTGSLKTLRPDHARSLNPCPYKVSRFLGWFFISSCRVVFPRNNHSSLILFFLTVVVCCRFPFPSTCTPLFTPFGCKAPQLASSLKRKVESFLSGEFQNVLINANNIYMIAVL